MKVRLAHSEDAYNIPDLLSDMLVDTDHVGYIQPAECENGIMNTYYEFEHLIDAPAIIVKYNSIDDLESDWDDYKLDTVRYTAHFEAIVKRRGSRTYLDEFEQDIELSLKLHRSGLYILYTIDDSIFAYV